MAIHLAGTDSDFEFSPSERQNLPPLRDQEFRLFQDLIYEKSGIFLGPFKKARLLWKLSRRMREIGLQTFQEYYDYCLKQGREEIHRMLESICTHETHFFREPLQMQMLEQEVFPGWKEQKRQQRKVKIWSAACSTGEEPYTLSMLLQSHLPVDQGWQHQIWATDLSRPAVEKAKRGIWPIAKSKEIPYPLLQQFMLRGVGSHQGEFSAAPVTKGIIQFDVLNLNDDAYPTSDLFDAIFCRNVLIYFSAESRGRVIDKLLRHLTPGGLLFLGHAETLHAHPRVTRSSVPAVYRYLGPGGTP